MAAERQAPAARKLAKAMQPAASDPHIAAALVALVGCAEAIDAEPGKAALWKEYRELLRMVAAVGETDSVQRRVVEFMKVEGG